MRWLAALLGRWCVVVSILSSTTAHANAGVSPRPNPRGGYPLAFVMAMTRGVTSRCAGVYNDPCAAATNSVSALLTREPSDASSFSSVFLALPALHHRPVF